MFTQPPAPTLATTVNIDGMDFERTDIPNGVDDSGLLVAKTLITRGQAAHAARRLQELRGDHRPITHGQIAMHAKSGDADVVGWGDGENPATHLRFPERLNGQDISWDEKGNLTLQAAFSGELFSSALLSVRPGFEQYPATVSWINSVALAAAKTEADARFLVRLMRVDEDKALLRYVYGNMSKEEIQAMSILGGNVHTASVVGPKADQRTLRGITDAFGGRANWLNNLYHPKQLIGDDVQFLRLRRFLRGFSRDGRRVGARVDDNVGFNPGGAFGCFGVRLVAVPRL